MGRLAPLQSRLTRVSWRCVRHLAADACPGCCARAGRRDGGDPRGARTHNDGLLPRRFQLPGPQAAQSPGRPATRRHAGRRLPEVGIARESELSHVYMCSRCSGPRCWQKKKRRQTTNTQRTLAAAKSLNTLPGLLDRFRPDLEIFHQRERHNRADPPNPNCDALAGRWRMCN